MPVHYLKTAPYNLRVTNMNSISFVVPVYNGAMMIQRLYDRLTPVARTFGNYEIVFVDDGSTDESYTILEALQANDANVCAVQLSRNFGQHNATLAGLSCAQGDVVVTLDQDLQNPPEEIPRLVEKLVDGVDVVYGLPEERAYGFFRSISSAFSKWISRKILSTALRGNFSSFRVLRKWVVDEIVKYKSSYVYIDGLIGWTTTNVSGVPVRNVWAESESHYTLPRLINHGLNLLVNFSLRPLQLASLVGTASAIVGLLGAMIVIAEKIFLGVSVQGWTSLMVVILVVGGLQIGFLGLIGEYTGRILMNSNSSPVFVIREIKKGKGRRAKKKK